MKRAFLIVLDSFGIGEMPDAAAFGADGKVGYAYMLTWFDTEDNQIARITITDENGYQISHDGYYYKVGADLCIDTELIAAMLNIAFSSVPAPAPAE